MLESVKVPKRLVCRVKQKKLAISMEEWEILKQRRKEYEEMTGDIETWGHFLEVITVLGVHSAKKYRVKKTLCVYRYKE